MTIPNLEEHLETYPMSDLERMGLRFIEADATNSPSKDVILSLVALVMRQEQDLRKACAVGDRLYGVVTEWESLAVRLRPCLESLDTYLGELISSVNTRRALTILEVDAAETLQNECRKYVEKIDADSNPLLEYF